MITGGNSGIGKWLFFIDEKRWQTKIGNNILGFVGKCIALDIAKRGGTVHLVCRNTKSAEEVQEEIKKSSGNNVRNIQVSITYLHTKLT